MSSTASGIETGRQRHKGKLSQGINIYIAVWMIVSVVPIAPYAIPLWNHALADTPYAYLIWIPVFGLIWGAISLKGIARYKDDAELNAILGFLLLGLAGTVLFAGMTEWSHIFIANNAGLLVWPFWSMGAAWLLFGIGVTRRLIKPLAYILLAWPPLYTVIVNHTNPLLYGIANAAVVKAAHLVPWLQMSGTYGNYLVNYKRSTLLVTVSSACSGGDSFLAMLILLPVILVAFKGGPIKKILLIAIGTVLTVVMNLLRLFVLLISAHTLGGNFTFGILHPIIGVLLFLGIMGVLALIGKSIGMKGRTSSATGHLSVPGWGRAGTTITAGLALTVLLWPLYSWGEGSFRSPVTVSTNNLSQLMPNMPGYHRTLLGKYNEASVLGPGSYGTAFAYSNSNGQYAMAELWWTYNASAMKSYGVNNCMLFHGDQIAGKHTFTLTPGISATTYAVLLAPSKLKGKRNLFEDVSYMYAVKYKGKTAYIRAEFATPVKYGISTTDSAVKQLGQSLPALWSAQSKGLSAQYSDINATQLDKFHSFVRTFSDITLKKKALAPQKA
ncbi:exosortase/archaeosortase family protein [Alicyclobacillus sp. SO9]|uniref:exosortase/archaeosortase family protein n=1 Tax=Alicyclobacillus sp. SO9 TaxID=2665646 RepID=UPI0018E90133|nr:exosortase/archaeosortase family protein [Alicyclobacillus sp. SO9]QQE79320.1 exosortase/archaeosortase family protein [Alicyclobacillus sp. SO9]